MCTINNPPPFFFPSPPLHSTQFLTVQSECTYPRDMRARAASCRACCPQSRQGAQPHSSIPRLTSKYHSETSVMADFSQVNTEECSVCKTRYPTCLTCRKYGSRHKHSFDREKSKNAHDNPSYVNDEGKPQSHWNGKESKQKSKISFYFHFRTTCGLASFCSFPFCGLTPAFLFILVISGHR